LRTSPSAVVAFLFDILESNGADLRAKPWSDRRVFLERGMARNRSNALHLSEAFDDAYSVPSESAGLEGIVCRSCCPRRMLRLADRPIEN
jgi:ATP-dependent DNA ligase